MPKPKKKGNWNRPKRSRQAKSQPRSSQGTFARRKGRTSGNPYSRRRSDYLEVI